MSSVIRPSISEYIQKEYGPDDQKEEEYKSNNERRLVISEEPLYFRDALWIGVDKGVLATNNFRAVRGVLRVETVLLKARRTDIRTRYGRCDLQPCSVLSRRIVDISPSLDLHLADLERSRPQYCCAPDRGRSANASRCTGS